MSTFSRLPAVLALCLLPWIPSSAIYAQVPTPTATPRPVVAEDHLAVQVRVTDGHTAVERTRRQLGFSMKDSAGSVAFSADPAMLKAALRAIAPAFHREVAEPRPTVDKGKFEIFEGRPGQDLNVAATAQAIEDAAARDAAMERFDAVLETHAPTGSTSRFQGVDGVLASFSTRTSANVKRNHNVELGVSRINGELMAPGQVFSLNAAVGQRTQARGFRTAPVFVDAKMVPGIGGGISQVTGTLFNAVARAGLKIVEVNPHSRPVAYLPIGYDATVAYGEEDLKFKNDTTAPVYIDYRFDPKTRRLTATVFGKTVPGRTIRLRANVHQIAAGKVDAELYRVTKDKGVVVAKERLFVHHYRWDPTTKA